MCARSDLSIECADKCLPNLISLRTEYLPLFLWQVVKCHLDGSPEIQRLDINSKYEVSIKIVLSCKEDTTGLRNFMVGKSEISVWVDPPHIFRALFPKPMMEETGNAVLRASLNRLQVTPLFQSI